MSVLEIETAEVFVPLLDPARYKGAYGGRGSGKSHFFAEKLIDDSLAEPGENGGEGLRSVCLREVQKDLAQSAKLLIEQKLNKFKLGSRHGFKVYRESISTPGDGIIIFKGMNDYSADSIKSLEGFKRGWWEESHTATANSLKIYRPTLRAEGAERWFSWNPRRKTDPVDMLLRGTELPTGSQVVEANWRDNPWFTDELEQERLDTKRTDPDQYDHIWEGDYVSVIEGAYYAKHINKAKAEHRVGPVSVDPLLSYHTFWDIGGTGAKADAVAIWVVQFVGKEIRLVDYYESIGQPLATHVNWLREREYGPKRTQVWLPHDGSTHDKVYDVSYESALIDAGYDVTVVPNQGRGAAKQRIEAGRRYFRDCYFHMPSILADDIPSCEAGLEALGWYHEKRDEIRGIGLGPEHDWSSHGADAFGLMAICAEEIQASQGRRIGNPYEGMDDGVYAG
jgi:phage terminase large subunit